VNSRQSCPEQRGDSGASLTEVLIAIVLMGGIVIALLVGVRTVVRATGVDRDHAQSFEWLQAASDAVYVTPRIPCTDDGQGRLDAIAAYDVAAQSASIPPVWDGSAASIRVTNVEYLGRFTVDDDFEWGQNFCFETAAFAGSPLYTQRVTIEVLAPGSAVPQRLEMVKSQS
jgi:hypothetical protein